MEKEYGYIENGYLRSRALKPYTESFKMDNGEIGYRTVSIEEQVSLMSDRWKPIEEIDESKLQCDDNYFIRLIPYDAGDIIKYQYHKIFDIKKINCDIDNLKKKLTNDDYKITKCYEASLLGTELPYDIAELHAQRQAERDEINQLENML